MQNQQHRYHHEEIYQLPTTMVIVICTRVSCIHHPSITSHRSSVTAVSLYYYKRWGGGGRLLRNAFSRRVKRNHPYSDDDSLCTYILVTQIAMKRGYGKHDAVYTLYTSVPTPDTHDHRRRARPRPVRRAAFRDVFEHTNSSTPII